MKLSYVVCCTLFVAVLTGHSTAASINQPGKTACGSDATADYKGACDESVPVIIMPKGRPIMERVLDWFKCDNEECQPEKPEEPESSEEITTTPIPTTTTPPPRPPISAAEPEPEPGTTTYPGSESPGAGGPGYETPGTGIPGPGYETPGTGGPGYGTLGTEEPVTGSAE